MEIMSTNQEGSSAKEEKVSVTTNMEKLNELLSLAETAEKIDSTTPEGSQMRNEIRSKARTLAREAFGGFDVGIKDNIYHFALYDGEKVVGASSPDTTWYNPNIDWNAVKKAVNALWDIDEKIDGIKLFDRRTSNS